MKNVMQSLVNSWFELLDGNLSYDGHDVNVYKEDADNTDAFHHVEIKAESETDDSNKTAFVTNAVVTIDIVTVHPVSVQRSIVDSIDDQIRGLLFPTGRQHALPALTDLQISTVKAQGGSYLKDDDGTKRYYRKVTRFIHRINQTS
jgi:hypothetical protein